MTEPAVFQELERLKFPVVNYVQKSKLAAPPLNNFAIALSLFMLSAPMMGWVDYESPTLGTLVGIGGILLYIAGFYDWYQRLSIASFVDFIFAFLHLTIYYSTTLNQYGIDTPHNYYSYLQGTFYIIYLVAIIMIILGVKDKGPLHLLAFVLYAVGTVLVATWEYAHYKGLRIVAGYFIFIGSIFFWLCGLGKLLRRVFGLKEFPGVSPCL